MEHIRPQRSRNEELDLLGDEQHIGFNDIAFANGYLYSTGMKGTHAFDVTNPALPGTVRAYPTQGQFLTTNGRNILGIGQESLVGVFTIGPGPDLSWFYVYHLPNAFNLANPIMFHPQAWISEQRLVTMVDEKDPMTGKPARTIAFDVFDFSIYPHDGFDDRLYENRFVRRYERGPLQPIDGRAVRLRDR